MTLPPHYTAMLDRDAKLRADAHVSECGRYRYWLTRDWDESLPRVCFVMLNPSTADASQDDPTIRKCMAFVRAWGCGGLDVRNLFPFRSPSPKVMMKARNPTGGALGDSALCVLKPFKYIVVAWGTDGGFLNRDRRALDIIGQPVHCLGVTKDGYPKHPLYIKGDTQPIPYHGRAA